MSSPKRARTDEGEAAPKHARVAEPLWYFVTSDEDGARHVDSFDPASTPKGEEIKAFLLAGWEMEKKKKNKIIPGQILHRFEELQKPEEEREAFVMEEITKGLAAIPEAMRRYTAADWGTWRWESHEQEFQGKVFLYDSWN